MATKRLLYVEREHNDVMLLGVAIDDAGLNWSLRHVTTGAEALALLGAGGFDLLVLTPTLPDLSWQAVIEGAHERRPDLPVVMLTGQRREALREAAFAEDASAYLLKPTNYEDYPRLLRQLDGLLNADRSRPADGATL